VRDAAQELTGKRIEVTVVVRKAAPVVEPSMQTIEICVFIKLPC
jgi:hypothetical protein